MRMTLLVGCGLLVACGGDATGPAPGGDWPVATPASVGLDAGRLDDAVRHIRDDLPNLNALLVVRNGQLVLEEYFHAADRSTLHPARSVTKGVTAAMVGVALDRGWIDSLDQPLHTLLPPDLAGHLEGDAQNITVRLMLTMSSGVALDASTQLSAADNWVVRMLDGDLWTTPGAGFRYDGSNPHLLSAVISLQTGFSMEEAAEEFLFGPLGIDVWTWASDPQGVTNGSTGLALTAPDLAKVGELFLRDGVWDNTRVLPAGWPDTVGTQHVSLGNGVGYGFQWWVMPTRLGVPAYFAAGFREQYIVVLPDLDIVVAIASESLDVRGPEADHLHLVPDFIVPAALPSD